MTQNIQPTKIQRFFDHLAFFLLPYLLGATALLLILSACATVQKPPSRGAKEVLVPVPVACEIKTVDRPAYPSAQAKKGDGIFTLAKIAAADRKVRAAENERLRAANTSPCPPAAPIVGR